MADMEDLNHDVGLGYCLQCTGEWKQSNYTKPKPRWAIVNAPSPIGVIGVCLDHLTVDQPVVVRGQPGMPNGPINIPELRRRPVQ